MSRWFCADCADDKLVVHVFFLPIIRFYECRFIDVHSWNAGRWIALCWEILIRYGVDTFVHYHSVHDCCDVWLICLCCTTRNEMRKAQMHKCTCCHTSFISRANTSFYTLHMQNYLTHINNRYRWLWDDHNGQLIQGDCLIFIHYVSSVLLWVGCIYG